MFILAILLSYCIGSISTSTLLARWVAGIDIREHGSGNAGATNTLRVLGIKLALLVLAVDIVKGMVAVGLAWWIGHGTEWIVYCSGFAAILGHNWPVFFQFRGGKGVATTIGVLALLVFVPALLAGVIAMTLVIVTRFVSVGALAFTILTPVFVAVLEPHRIGAIILACMVGVMSIYRHRRNIERLFKGQEHRIFSKRT